MTTTLLPCGPAMLSRLKLSGDLPQDRIYTKFKLIAHKFDICVAEITSDLAKNSREYSWGQHCWSMCLPGFSNLTTVLVWIKYIVQSRAEARLDQGSGAKNKSCLNKLKKHYLTNHYLQNLSIFTNKKVLFLKKYVACQYSRL